MNKEEAINLAKEYAKENGYTWHEPIHAQKRKTFILFGTPMWYIVSNADMRGGNIYTLINAKTKSIIKQSMTTR